MNKKLAISGVVQGVGFRPFIYQLALRHNLNGYIVNNTSGVDVEVEGSEDSILLFMDALKNELPPLARIDSLESLPGEYKGYSSFQIQHSETLDSKSALVSPDIAICNNCLKEMNDPNNRRYNYPFINCTDCGPRYSIMKTLPYDRPHTSMQRFDMCKTCYNEYSDALDRRFHAQPISCHECGPKLILRSTDGKELANDKDALTLTADAIKQGHIVAVKGLGGFHLICDATNSKAVEKLRQRKGRLVKPFAVMFPDIDMLKN
ncbi:MAG TPA: acylphosphatase, partial [Sulfurovum sp.]